MRCDARSGRLTLVLTDRLLICWTTTVQRSTAAARRPSSSATGAFSNSPAAALTKGATHTQTSEARCSRGKGSGRTVSRRCVQLTLLFPLALSASASPQPSQSLGSQSPPCRLPHPRSFPPCSCSWWRPCCRPAAHPAAVLQLQRLARSRPPICTVWAGGCWPADRDHTSARQMSSTWCSMQREKVRHR